MPEIRLTAHGSIEQAVVLTTGETLTAYLLPQLAEKTNGDEIAAGTSLDEGLVKFKKQLIAKTLTLKDYKQTKVAEILGIQRTYLNRLIRELNVHQ